MDSVEIQGCRQSTLIAFNNVLFGTTTKAILDVHEVPFGQVAVYGSGVSDDHAVEQYKTLAYLLLKTPADDLETAAFHLTRTHGWSDQVVKADVRYGFKTFGGATLAMALIPDPKDPKGGVDLILIKGEFNRKSDGKVISNIFKNKDGEICAKGEDGKTSILKPFSQYGLGQLDSLQLAR